MSRLTSAPKIGCSCCSAAIGAPRVAHDERLVDQPACVAARSRSARQPHAARPRRRGSVTDGRAAASGFAGGLISSSSTSNTSMPCGRSGLALVRRAPRESRTGTCRRPTSAECHRSSRRSRRCRLNSAGSPLDHRRVEHAAVGRPARVVARAPFARRRLRAALAGLEHLVEHALRASSSRRPAASRHRAAPAAAGSSPSRSDETRPRSRAGPSAAGTAAASSSSRRRPRTARARRPSSASASPRTRAGWRNGADFAGRFFISVVSTMRPSASHAV